MLNLATAQPAQSEIPEFPTFDGTIKELLIALHVSPVIITLVVLAFAMKSWVDGAKDTSEVVGRAGSGLRRAYGALSPLHGALATVTTALIVTAQLGMLWLVYVCGNLTSLFRHWAGANGDISSVDVETAARMRAFADAYDSEGVLAVWSAISGPYLALDWVAAAVLAIALLALWGGYRSARSSRRVGMGWGLTASMPVSAYLFMWAFGLAAVLFNRAVVGDSSRTREDLAFLLPAETACLLYCLTCVVAIKGARLVVSAWDNHVVPA